MQTLKRINLLNELSQLANFLLDNLIKAKSWTERTDESAKLAKITISVDSIITYTGSAGVTSKLNTRGLHYHFH